MKKELKGKVDLFLKNRRILKEEIKFDNENNYLLGAMMYTDSDESIDKKKIRKCLKLLKEKVSFFSDLRLLSLPLAIKMSLNENPEEYLEKVKENYKILTKNSVFGSYYKMLTAIIICDHKKEIDFEEFNEKEKRIYNMMSKNHPFLTNEEDIAFATLFALSDKKEESLIKEMEESYEILKKHLPNKNDAQEISEIIALEGKCIEKETNKVLELFELLKDQKKKIPQGFSFSILGSLATLKVDAKTLAEDIIEVDSYIGSQKGKGLWPFGKYTRLLVSMMIVESLHGNKIKNKTSGITLINTMITEEIVTSILAISIVLMD